MSEERRRSRLIAACACASGIALAAGFAATESYPLARELLLARGTGYAAAALLAASLAMSPLARIGRRGLAVALRRALGLAAAFAALVHIATTFAVGLVAEVSLLIYEPQLRAGLAAVTVLAVLALTSFPHVVQALGLRRWKDLHRLAYAAALFTLVHLALSPWTNPRIVYAALAVTALLLLARLRGSPAKPQSKMAPAQGAGIDH